MGPKYADPVILDLRAMWEESDTRTPMICLLSMGSDPTAMIEDLAKKNGIGLSVSVLCQALCGRLIHATVCGKRYSGSCSMTVGSATDIQFSGHSQQVTLVINPTVLCRYFLPGLSLLQRVTVLGRYQIELLVKHKHACEQIVCA